MRSFQRSIIIKVMALFLVFIFFSQQIGFAKVEDLRDADIETTDIVLAIGMGVLNAATSQASGPTWAMFAYNYLVPKVTDTIIEELNIDSPVLQIALKVGLSVSIKAGLDALLKHALKETVKETVKEAVKEGIKQAGAGASEEAIKESVKEAVKKALKETLKDAPKDVVDKVLKEVGGEVSEEVIEGALEEALTEALKGPLTQGLKEGLMGVTDEAVARAAAEGAKQGAEEAVEEIAQETLKTTTKGLLQKVVGGITNSIRNGFNKVKQFLGFGGKTAGKTIAQKVTEGITKEMTTMTPAKVLLYAGKSGIKAGVYAAAKEALYQNLKKKNKHLAQFLSGMGGMLVAETVGRGILGAPTKNFEERFIITTAAGGVETMAAMAGIEEWGVLLSAGTQKLASHWLMDKEEKAVAIKEEEVKKATYERKRDEKKQKLIMATNEKEKEKLTAQINFAEAQIKQAETKIKELSMTATDAFFEGLKFGALSAALQNLSLQTKSPVHGAVFNLYLAATAKALLVKDVYIFTGEDGKPINIDRATDPAIINNVTQAKGISRLHLWLNTLGELGTKAKADAMTFGQGEPVRNIEKTRQSGYPVFDVKLTQSAYDIFFITRYADYIKKTGKDFYPILSLTEQLLSSLHYQSVSTFSRLFPLGSDLRQGRFVLGERAQAPYVVTVSGGPGVKEQEEKYKKVIEEAEELKEEVKFVREKEETFSEFKLAHPELEFLTQNENGEWELKRDSREDKDNNKFKLVRQEDGEWKFTKEEDSGLKFKIVGLEDSIWGSKIIAGANKDRWNALFFKDAHQNWKETYRELKEQKAKEGLSPKLEGLYQSLENYFNLYSPENIEIGRYNPGLLGVMISKVSLGRDVLLGKSEGTQSPTQKANEKVSEMMASGVSSEYDLAEAWAKAYNEASENPSPGYLYVQDIIEKETDKHIKERLSGKPSEEIKKEAMDKANKELSKKISVSDISDPYALAKAWTDASDNVYKDKEIEQLVRYDVVEYLEGGTHTITNWERIPQPEPIKLELPLEPTVTITDLPAKIPGPVKEPVKPPEPEPTMQPPKIEKLSLPAQPVKAESKPPKEEKPTPPAPEKLVLGSPTECRNCNAEHWTGLQGEKIKESREIHRDWQEYIKQNPGPIRDTGSVGNNRLEIINNTLNQYEKGVTK